MAVFGIAVRPSRCFCIPGTGFNPKVIHVKAPSFQPAARLKEREKLQHARRIDVSNPYKRLGISKEASEDEIQAARIFLVQKYAGHRASADAIEFTHDKITMQKFYEKRKPKIDVKKKIRGVMTQSRVVQDVFSRFQIPSTKFVIKTVVTFLVLAGLAVLFPTKEGPTLQVTLSLIATTSFIHDRLKNKCRAAFL